MKKHIFQTGGIMKTSIIFYSLAFIMLLFSAKADKNKTKMALQKAYKSFMNLIPALIAMVLFVGLLLTYISPETISKVLGKESGIFGIVTGMIIGAVGMMPGFIAFPLGANLLNAGAGYPQVAGFLGTLMAVGVTTIFLEMTFFNKKTTIYRNLLAFAGSGLFALIIWMVM